MWLRPSPSPAAADKSRLEVKSRSFSAVDSDSSPDLHADAMDCLADHEAAVPSRGMHASSAQTEKIPSAESEGKWDWVPEYFPWGNRERLELDLWRVNAGICDSDWEWLIRILAQPWFNNVRLWKSIGEYEEEQKKIPRPTVLERKTKAIVRSGQSGYKHAVIAEFSLIETLRLLLADPLIRKTLDIDARKPQPEVMRDFLDTPFSRDPLTVADGSDFYIPSRANKDDLATGRLIVGDFARVVDGKESTAVVRIVQLAYNGTGQRSVMCERMMDIDDLRKHLKDRRKACPVRVSSVEPNELFRTTQLQAYEASAFIRKVNVTPTGEGKHEFKCAMQLTAAGKVEPCDLEKLRLELVRRLPVTLASGKVLWIILYLDGER